MEIAEFLLARIAEDEEAARAATPGPWTVASEADGRTGFDPRLSVTAGSTSVIDVDGEFCGDLWLAADPADLAHLIRHDPARVLAECDAKRQAISVLVTDLGLLGSPPFTPGNGRASRYAVAQTALCCLALPYADHPDWREEWAPVAATSAR